MIELPEFYYRTHFVELLLEIRTHRANLITPNHASFIEDFFSLTENAQCLWVRMVNRKGHCFSRQSLQYKEIQVDLAVEELLSKGFTRVPGDEDRNAVIDMLSKNELQRMLSEEGILSKLSWPRSKLAELCAANFRMPPQLLMQEKSDELLFLLFIYYGHYQENLILHTLRDLGVRKGNQKKGHLSPRFKSAAEALINFQYASGALPDDRKLWPIPMNKETWKMRDEALLDLAREASSEAALEILKEVRYHPGREKLCRLLWDLGRKDECFELLESICDSPEEDEEYFFALDFLERKFNRKRLSTLTEALRNSPLIRLDEGYFRHPELGVAALFPTAFVTENHLWVALFGIVFREELESNFHSEFDQISPDLWGPEFYLKHEASIEAKLANLQVPKTFEGTFRTYPETQMMIETLFRYAPENAVGTVLRSMARDFGQRSSGYPDLMRVEGDTLIFSEIKATGDSLRRHQMIRLKELEAAGLKVEILRVEYDANPDQPYVVVDIETTGLSPDYHRITEVGAVKVVQGKVVDTFQRLINPKQSIPRRIQELTGITNEMVKEAPAFADIADEFIDFVKGSIFAAHNVKFDYSFIQSEFSRLEKKFVMPFICTNAGMKKHFPGLGSYGLGSLTSHFQIPLKTHHRALCDAEAAAQLLLLINEKRREKLLTH